MHALSRSALLTALLLLGACGNTVNPTPSSTEGGNIGGGGGTGASSSGTSGTGSTGNSSGSTGTTGVACGASTGSIDTHELSVSWTFPGADSSCGSHPNVTRIEVQVSNLGHLVETNCAGNGLQATQLDSNIALLPPGRWATSVRASDSVGHVFFSGVRQFTVSSTDVLVNVPLVAGDIDGAGKVCGLPQ